MLHLDFELIFLREKYVIFISWKFKKELTGPFLKMKYIFSHNNSEVNSAVRFFFCIYSTLWRALLYLSQLFFHSKDGVDDQAPMSVWKIQTSKNISMCIFYDTIIGIIINILKVFNHVFNFISQVFNSTRCSWHSNIITI